MDIPKPDKEALNIPVPDPSELTTTQIVREIFHLRELLETRLTSIEQAGSLNREIIETRLDGSEKAVRLLQEITDKLPTRIDEKITALQGIHDQKFITLAETVSEKFDGIEKQFKERDVRTDQTARDTKTAVDAALAAQEKAAGKLNESSSESILKQEASFSKQIDQQAENMKNQTRATDDKIDDLKERLTRIESVAHGVGLNKTDSRAGRGEVIAIIALLITLGAALVGVVAFAVARS